MIMAMILAAGEGQRLRPITLSTPKVLAPLDSVPLVNYQLQWLKKHNIFDIVINLYHLGFKIEEHLGDGSRFGMHITYSHEEKLLGTAGSVKKVTKFLTPTFLVLYGDVLTNLDLSKMIVFHKEKGAAATLVLHGLESIVGKGVVTIDKSQRILSFDEKPSGMETPSALVNGGVYILNRDVLEQIDEDTPSDFGANVFPKVLKAGLPMYAYLLKRDDFLMDIGTPEMYRKADQFIANNREGFRF
jgi:NDP-sugar pyrophosphorylase family protein